MHIQSLGPDLAAVGKPTTVTEPYECSVTTVAKRINDELWTLLHTTDSATHTNHIMLVRTDLQGHLVAPPSEIGPPDVIDGWVDFIPAPNAGALAVFMTRRGCAWGTWSSTRGDPVHLWTDRRHGHSEVYAAPFVCE